MRLFRERLLACLIERRPEREEAEDRRRRHESHGPALPVPGVGVSRRRDARGRKGSLRAWLRRSGCSRTWPLARTWPSGSIAPRWTLLEHVVLALKGFEREEQVERADRAAALLRIHLRLALDLGQLDEDQFLHLASELDGIGRQIGGWQRRLLSDTMAGRHR